MKDNNTLEDIATYILLGGVGTLLFYGAFHFTRLLIILE